MVNPHILTHFTPRTDKFHHSFFPDCVFSWNRFLTSDQRNANNIDKFKKKLLSSFKPTRSNNFGIIDRLGLRFLTQLRVDLNPLRKYKFNHHFLDTSDELCFAGDGVEDIFHYLLDCHLFDNIRFTLLDNVSTLIGENVRILNRISLKNLLLYGRKDLKHEINNSILTETLKFIHSSEKFKST